MSLAGASSYVTERMIFPNVITSAYPTNDQSYYLPNAFPNLEVLNLSWTTVHDVTMRKIIGACPNLKTYQKKLYFILIPSLLLACCNSVTDNTISYITGENSSNFPSLMAANMPPSPAATAASFGPQLPLQANEPPRLLNLEVFDISGCQGNHHLSHSLILGISPNMPQIVLDKLKSLKLFVIQGSQAVLSQIPPQVEVVTENLWDITTSGITTYEKYEKYLNNLNCYGDLGKSLLHTACATGGAEELVKFLIDHGADPNLPFSAEQRFTTNPQPFGVQQMQEKQVIEDYKHAINPWIPEIPSFAAKQMINYANGNNWNNGSQRLPDTIPGGRPLHEAVARGADDVCMYLLTHGGKPDVKG